MGEDTPQFATILDDLGRISGYLGKFEEAERFFNETLEI